MFILSIPVISHGLSGRLNPLITMNGDKESLDAVLEQPCHHQLLPAIEKTESVVVKKSDKRNRINNHKKLIILLSIVIFIQVIALVFLVYDKFITAELSSEKLSTQSSSQCSENSRVTDYSETYEDRKITDVPADYLTELDYSYDVTIAASDSNLSSNAADEDPWGNYLDIEPRCFSMCEPPELFFRENFHLFTNLNLKYQSETITISIKLLVIKNNMSPDKNELFTAEKTNSSRQSWSIMAPSPSDITFSCSLTPRPQTLGNHYFCLR